MPPFLRSCLPAVLLALLAGSAAAQSPQPPAPDIVPLRFVNGLPFVQVAVGAARSEMMFDSGGGFGISLPSATIDAAGSVTMLDETSRFSDLLGQAHEVRKLVARRVTVGRTALEPVRGRVHVNWGGAPEGPDAALTRARNGGAIDLLAFGERALMFDYARRTLTIYAPGRHPLADPEVRAAGWQALHLEHGKIGPYVTLRVGGKPLKLVLDTGAPLNFINPGSLAGTAGSCDDEGDAPDPCNLPDVRTEGGAALGVMKARAMSLDGAPFDGLLGAPFFAARRVLFDPAAQRLLIAPADPAGAARSTAPAP